MASDSGAEIIKEIEALREKLYRQIGRLSQDSSRESLGCALALSRQLDEAIVRLMKERPELSGS